MTVVGLARSGVGAAAVLSHLGAHVTVNDIRPAEALGDAVAHLPAGVKTVFGSHPAELFRNADLVVVSPGVPMDIAPLRAAQSSGAEVIGELELGFRAAAMASADRPVPFAAITGSNGKSTTTSLLDLMLRKAGLRTVLAGNIGNSLCSELARLLDLSAHRWHAQRPDSIVVEVSSFQLEGIADFAPRVAAILNITPDHLDRYKSMADYASAKAAICRRQTPEDFLVLNADDPATFGLADLLRRNGRGPRIVFFSRRGPVEGVYEQDGKVYANLPLEGLSGCGVEIAAVGQIRIQGVHNLENAMTASAMALLAGSSIPAVREALAEFAGLEHRLEFVREVDGVRYINDSKGTNVGAVMKSLEGFSSPVVLIAGGRDKAGEFRELRPLVETRVKALVLIGEAAAKIREALGDLTRVVNAGSLQEAICEARALAEPGDTVLLSPACASFDMFRDYEDRGRQFKMIVEEL